MRTEKVGTGTVTTLEADDHAKIALLLERADGRVRLPALGVFKKMTDDDILYALAAQVCVMGSARGMDVIERDPKLRSAFIAQLRSAALAGSTTGRVRRLVAVLSQFGATRFPTKSATTLSAILAAPSVYKGSRFVIFDGLEAGRDPQGTRETIRERIPGFNMKSASDFMITNGLSHDVIALDTRVVGALRDHFDYQTPVSKVQSKPEVYLSVEGALRQACRRIGKPLGLLDRAIFQLAGKSALDFILSMT